jgi:hypothetical protein
MHRTKTALAALFALATIPLTSHIATAETPTEEPTSEPTSSEPTESLPEEPTIPTEVFPIPPDAAPFGKTMSEWAAGWYQWALPMPKSTSPVFEAPCGNGQSDSDVFFLAGNVGGTSVRDCTIPADHKIFFPIMNLFVRQLPEYASTCSWLVTEQQLHDYLVPVYDTQKVELYAELDGVPIAGPEEHRHQTGGFTWAAPTSPAAQWLFRLISPIVEPNACNLPAGPRLGYGDGFWLMLYALEPGPHTLHFGGSLTYDDGYVWSLDVTYHLVQE